MNLYRDVVACTCLLIGACSPAAPGNRSTADAPRKTVAAQVPAVVPAKPAGCSEAIHVALDEPSLIDPATQKPFPAARLRAFSGKAAAAFHDAADAACRSTPAVRKALASIHRLIVQSGAGASEATFYRTEQEKPDELVFQWVFNEAGLDVPKRADIAQGLRCWADPHRAECADMGD
jgi:hypothetical protein